MRHGEWLKVVRSLSEDSSLASIPAEMRTDWSLDEFRRVLRIGLDDCCFLRGAVSDPFIHWPAPIRPQRQASTNRSLMISSDTDTDGNPVPCITIRSSITPSLAVGPILLWSVINRASCAIFDSAATHRQTRSRPTKTWGKPRYLRGTADHQYPFGLVRFPPATTDLHQCRLLDFKTWPSPSLDSGFLHDTCRDVSPHDM